MEKFIICGEFLMSIKLESLKWDCIWESVSL